MNKEDKRVAEYNARMENEDEVKKILKDAWDKDFEEAKKNGMKNPRKSLHWHTNQQDRDKILKVKNLG